MPQPCLHPAGHQSAAACAAVPGLPTSLVKWRPPAASDESAQHGPQRTPAVHLPHLPQLCGAGLTLWCESEGVLGLTTGWTLLAEAPRSPAAQRDTPMVKRLQNTST